MSTQTASTAADAASAAQTKGPATLVVAGVLALALGGLGVAAFTISKKNTPMAAKGGVDADSAAKAKSGGVPSQASITIKPQEDAPLSGVSNASNATHAGKGAPGAASAFPQEDPSLK